MSVTACEKTIVVACDFILFLVYIRSAILRAKESVQKNI